VRKALRKRDAPKFLMEHTIIRAFTSIVMETSTWGGLGIPLMTDYYESLHEKGVHRIHRVSH
jgi:hypothetical protein